MSMEMLTMKTGAEWKNLRAIMTPTFTSGKIKSMFPLVCDKADALVKFSMKQAAENPHVDMKNNFGRFTMDTIASCAFGIECNSLVIKMLNSLARQRNFSGKLYSNNEDYVVFVMPKPFKFFRAHLNPSRLTSSWMDKENCLRPGRGGRSAGLSDLLLEARDDPDNPNNKQVLGELTIVAQSVLFLAAGYDTTASCYPSPHFLAAKNNDQQHRLRDELRQMVAEHGDITYQPSWRTVPKGRLPDPQLIRLRFARHPHPSTIIGRWPPQLFFLATPLEDTLLDACLQASVCLWGRAGQLLLKAERGVAASTVGV
ncbi:Cytochrome P450 6a2 [Chionoecetes opilio]|uniref:Cytochrome P450 6a2 n=1 Tax=Chionoecetes opilio TaxID=41210 RepID=A0A8J4Y919_CHIOP|nr:Cytochrome P450 6a2 [Chionoecetes opilio]